jgi:carbamoyltransferase
MKDILNSKVKFREWYRPFAPSCRKEDALKCFKSFSYEYLEYMSFAPEVLINKRLYLPSITHVDGTSRLQIVSEDTCKIFYDILTSFSRISGIPVLLNTSFNIKGLPILTTIKDALYVLDNTQMDYVVIENFLFNKK